MLVLVLALVCAALASEEDPMLAGPRPISEADLKGWGLTDVRAAVRALTLDLGQTAPGWQAALLILALASFLVLPLVAIVYELCSQRGKTAGSARGLSVLQLALLMFFFTSGGPFGVEPAIGAAGAILTIAGAFGAVLLWGVPQALLTLELGAMLPVGGGAYVWGYRACGPLVGWVNAWNFFASYLVALGMTVDLLSTYIDMSGSLGVKFGISSAFVLGATLVAIFGAKWVARFNALLIIVLFAPFIAAICWILAPSSTLVLPAAGAQSIFFVPSWDQIPYGALATYVSVLMWVCDGFDQVGSIAHDVLADGGRTFKWALTLVLPLIVLNFALPILIAFPLHPVFRDWGVSGGANAADFTSALMGAAEWLGVWAIVGAVCALFAQLSTGLVALAHTANVAAQGEHRMLPSPLALMHRGSPVIATVACGVTILLLTLMPFSYIAQTYLVARGINLLILYASLIVFRLAEPDLPRPYRNPTVLVYLLGVPTLLVTLFGIFFSHWQVYVISGVFEALVVGGYFLSRCFSVPGKTAPMVTEVTLDPSLYHQLIDRRNGDVDGADGARDAHSISGPLQWRDVTLPDDFDRDHDVEYVRPARSSTADDSLLWADPSSQ